MTTLGATMVLEKHGGSALAVAEALILGELKPSDIDCVHEIVHPIVLEAARIRLEATGQLTSKHIK